MIAGLLALKSPLPKPAISQSLAIKGGGTTGARGALAPLSLQQRVLSPLYVMAL